MILAGSETVSVKLAAATYQLLTTSNTLDKLVREIQHSIVSEDKNYILALNQIPICRFPGL